MKTLNEVIKALEICSTHLRCDVVCPYHKNGCVEYEMEKDALHYLKHLQEFYEMSREHHEPNPALTWAELRTMEGKPVWIENKFYKKWLIAYQINENDIIFDGNGFYTQAYVIDYGKSWQAYRKERP